MSTPEHQTSSILVENFHCKVEIGEDGTLYCSTEGRFFTVILFVLGMILIYASIIIIGWDLPKGRIHSSSLLVGSVVFIAGIFFQWRCLRRKKELGKFELNSQTRIISKPGTGATYSYDYVNRLRMTVDFTAIVRLHQLSSTPYWLFIHFKNGRQIRVATGRRDEIISVLRWMKDAGIPGVEWV